MTLQAMYMPNGFRVKLLLFCIQIHQKSHATWDLCALNKLTKNVAKNVQQYQKAHPHNWLMMRALLTLGWNILATRICKRNQATIFNANSILFVSYTFFSHGILKQKYEHFTKVLLEDPLHKLFQYQVIIPCEKRKKKKQQMSTVCDHF